MNSATSSRSLRVFETICQELLARLEGNSSEQAMAFRGEADELLATLARWAEEAPTQSDRAAVLSRVLDLHRTVMDYLTIGGSKPPQV